MRITVLDLNRVPREIPRHALRERLLHVALRRLGFGAAALAGLRQDALGRPQLDPPLRLSLSYGGTRALCAVSADGAVGVDLESLAAAPPGRTSLYLSAHERRAAGDDPGRRLALWTQKEAVAKAAGIGGLRRLDRVEIDGARARVGLDTWHTHRLDLAPGWVAHLACASPAPAIEVLRLGPETLL